MNLKNGNGKISQRKKTGVKINNTLDGIYFAISLEVYHC